MCKHIWYKEYAMEDYTKYYCMRCLKKIKVFKNDKKLNLLKVAGDYDDLIKEIKKIMNWEENTTGLTFNDFKYAIKKVLEDEE